MEKLQWALLLYSLFVVNGQYAPETVNVDHCQKTFTLGYGYKNLYRLLENREHVGEKLIFRFYVKAPSDAHVLFTQSDQLQNDEPAYEIVIGAGRNTFSVIRRQRRKSTQATQSSPNILSPDVYRGFWISIARNGLIEVGKAGEEAPFLFWNDPMPIVVNYFSFCNWGSTVGQWAYSCTKENPSEKVEVNLTTIEKLRNDVLGTYDPFTRPVINAEDVTTIFLEIQNRAVKINEKDSTMDVIADVQLNWTDEKIQWNPEMFENISRLHFPFHELWQPSFVVFNSADSLTDVFADAPLAVTSYGNVTWKTQMNLKVRCNLDLSMWPHDKQDCGIHLGFWDQQDYLSLEYTKEIDDNPYLTNSQWEILQVQVDNITLTTPWINKTDEIYDKAVNIRYTLQRNSPLLNAVFWAPLLTITIMTLIPFWISPLNSHKLNTSCLSLVIMVIFIVGMAKILPAPADHVPKLIQLYSHGMLAVTFSILISVTVIHLARNSHPYPLPEVLIKVLKGKFLHTLLLLPAVINKNATDYGNLLEADNALPTTDPSNSDDPELRQQWIIMAQVIDRLAFLIYSIYFFTVFIL